jgi:hypothetical protein
MKERFLGRQVFLAGCVTALAFGCQGPKAPPSTPPATDQQSDANQNPAQSDNEDTDGDDGAYGSGDTTSQLEKQEIELSMDTGAEVPNETAVVELSSTASDEVALEEEAAVDELTVLQSVSPVDIVTEHQVEETDPQ